MKSGAFLVWQSRKVAMLQFRSKLCKVWVDIYIPVPAGYGLLVILPFVFLSRMEGVHRSTSSLPTAGSVNIKRAETSFNELSRQLTQGTVVDDNEQGVGDSSAVDGRKARDVEKGALDLERPFDLREFLSSSNDANERAGIKHKHVGVLWDGFHVDVLGGSDFKVSDKPVTIADADFTRSGK